MIHLQKRDRTILEVCYEQQFLITEHLKYFFQTHRTVPYRRLGALKKAGFINAEYHPLFGKHSILRLTPSGRAIAEKECLVQVPFLKKLNPNTLVHDALVTSVRLRILQLWNARFLPERAIKQKGKAEIPDGIFSFSSGKGVALEVENSDKGKIRFKTLLDRWQFQSSIGIVLYVAATPDLFRILSGYLKEASLSVEPLIGLVLWDSLKDGTPTVTTQLGPADLFSKRELRL